jgi:CheY-like chemotaxis protein/HPt (histidine-containing phosphotransfer) domain-containing protein
MNGTIGVESTMDVGSTFWFEVEFGKMRLADFEEQEQQKQKDLSGKKFKGAVLVAEDNIINQTVILGLLEDFGIKADLAKNGEEALAMLAVKSYDLVCMDCQMPKMDGYTASRRIRQQKDASSKIPIIAMTANAMKGDDKKCLEAGMSDYMTKPLNPEILAQKLAKWLPANEQNSDVSGLDTQAIHNLEQRVDYKVIHSLRDMKSGSQSILEEAGNLLIEEFPKHLEIIRAAVAKGDFPELSDQAHQLKSATGSLGAVYLSSLFNILQADHSQTDPQALDKLLQEIVVSYQEFKIILQQEISLALKVF